VKPLLKLWYLIEFGAASTALWILAVLPPQLTLVAAGVLARLIFVLWRSRRRIAVNNLLQCRLCDTAEDARRLALESFRSFTLTVVETILLRRRLTAQNWTEFVTLKLTPEAEKLLHEPGKGLLVASAHIGNWEVAARAVSMIKPMCVVYRPFNNPYLDRMTHAARSGEHLHFLSRLEAEPMRFIQALAKGEMVVLMIDQHVVSGRVRVEFFGRPAWTTKATAMLHLTTRAPLVAAFAIRTGPLRYEIHAVGPVVCERSGDREKDALTITQELTREIEAVVRRFPEQYLWGHRRWKE
jgi:KDO2-lipid IV(A) lauroyltransferase